MGEDAVGRVSLRPRHEVAALSTDDRIAVEALERHLWPGTTVGS